MHAEPLRDGRRHLIAMVAARTVVVGPAAAALAAVSVEPIPFGSAAEADTRSGEINTNDIGRLLCPAKPWPAEQRKCWFPQRMAARSAI
jgi:hypothetical protein